MKPKKKDKNYNFILITHRLLEHYNSGTMTRRVNVLNKIKSEAFVEINKSDAMKLGIRNNQKVKIESNTGNLIIKAKINNRVKKGIVAIPNHFKDAKVNKLIGNVLDPVSKTPMFKYCKVKIQKIK